MKIELGVMQGRLSPQCKTLIQHYPLRNWKNEFKIASEIGIKHIEWIFEYPNFEKNVIFSKKKTIELKKIIRKYGVLVNTLIMDYFLVSRFFNEKKKTISRNFKIFEKIVKNCYIAGISIIEIPLVDNSSISKIKNKNEIIENIKKIILIAEKYKIKISLETDLPPKEFKNFIDIFLPKRVYVNYDIGNSAALSYDPAEEIKVLGKRFINVHIKDRLLFGKSVKFGNGNADFSIIFELLKKMKYRGFYTIQGARLDKIYNYVDVVKFYIKFIQNIFYKRKI